MLASIEIYDATESGKKLGHDVYIGNIWHIYNGASSFGQQCGRHQFQGRILRTGNVYFADKAGTTIYSETFGSLRAWHLLPTL